MPLWALEVATDASVVTTSPPAFSLTPPLGLHPLSNPLLFHRRKTRLTRTLQPFLSMSASFSVLSAEIAAGVLK